MRSACDLPDNHTKKNLSCTCCADRRSPRLGCFRNTNDHCCEIDRTQRAISRRCRLRSAGGSCLRNTAHLLLHRIARVCHRGCCVRMVYEPTVSKGGCVKVSSDHLRLRPRTCRWHRSTSVRKTVNSRRLRHRSGSSELASVMGTERELAPTPCLICALSG